MKNCGQVIKKEILLQTVWGYIYEGRTRTVDTHVENIRHKLDLKESLITIPKVGYYLKGVEEQ